jgi:multidrug resistance efflux pump
MSAQSRDEAVTSLQALEAAVRSAEHALASAQASLREARAHELLAVANAKSVESTRNDAANARALADQARVQKGYAQVFAPVSGRVNVWATRQGEVVSAATPIVTIMDLTQTWVYAPLPETQADAFGRNGLGPCDQQGHRGRLCHAARCRQSQTRHQDGATETRNR